MGFGSVILLQVSLSVLTWDSNWQQVGSCTVGSFNGTYQTQKILAVISVVLIIVYPIFFMLKAFDKAPIMPQFDTSGAPIHSYNAQIYKQLLKSDEGSYKAFYQGLHYNWRHFNGMLIAFKLVMATASSVILNGSFISSSIPAPGVIGMLLLILAYALEMSLILFNKPYINRLDNSLAFISPACSLASLLLGLIGASTNNASIILLADVLTLIVFIAGFGLSIFALFWPFEVCFTKLI
jgi:hypothetical protein